MRKLGRKTSEPKYATLYEAIERDIVTFQFTKKLGSSRIARGTRNLNLIPKEAHPTGSGVSKVNEDILVFYDFTRSGWRSCRRDSIFGSWEVKNEDLLKRINSEK